MRNGYSQPGAGLGSDVGDGGLAFSSAVTEKLPPLSEPLSSNLRLCSGVRRPTARSRGRLRLWLPILAGFVVAAAAYELSAKDLPPTPAAPSSRETTPPPLNARPYAPDIRVGMGTDIRNTGAPAPSRGSAVRWRNGVALSDATASSIAPLTNGRV